jgi:hypothetical protein
VAVPTGAQRSFAPANFSQGSIPLSPGPFGKPPPALGSPRKKRGRPSKVELEERRIRLAEAKQSKQQRDSEPKPLHQLLPSPQRPRDPQYRGSPVETPLRSPVTAGMGQAGPITTPQGANRAPSNNSSSSGKRRRGRPPKISETVAGPAYPAPTRSEAYETPPQNAPMGERGDSTTETFPREQAVGSSSAADEQRRRTAQEEADESRPLPRWQDTILRK